MKSSPFRSIRQKLFNEGKLFRYLGYAIGEIALIIIGILFALQISNWNEDRKAQVEFEVYIEQLKADVRTAIENVERSKNFAESNLEKAEYSLRFLEFGIIAPGSYSEPQVYVGLLGQMMNGNMEIIGRDRLLGQKALEMESSVEQWKSNLDHVFNQIDLDNSNINLFRGKGNDTLGVRPRYNLEILKTSEEFKNATYSVNSRVRTIIRFTGEMIKDLEAFLKVLEEY
jgi:hypothetical protein